MPSRAATTNVAHPFATGSKLLVMPQVPAVCDSCSRLFPSGIVLTNVTHATLTGNKSGPCPFCGSMGSILDGVYEATETTVSAVLAGATSVDALRRLAAALDREKADPTTAQHLAETIRRDAPEFSVLADTAAALRGVRLAEWIVIVLMLISLIVPQLEAAKAQQQTHQDLERIYSELLRLGPPLPVTASPNPNGGPTSGPTKTTVPKIGRNQPCPCGSGRKYKRCHGG